MGLKFSLDDPYILSQAIQTANNNQASLQATLAETDFLRGSSVTSDTQALNATLGTPFPSAYQASQNTVGAALGDIGQEGTYSEDTDGGGLPCFEGQTLITLGAFNYTRQIKDIKVGYDRVLAFDVKGNTFPALVTDKFEHYYHQSFLVIFEDGRRTLTTQEHRYWDGDISFTPIAELNEVVHWDNGWKKVAIKDKEIINKPIVLYNLTVEKYHTYLANGDGVHNLKPAGNDPFGG